MYRMILIVVVYTAIRRSPSPRDSIYSTFRRVTSKQYRLGKRRLLRKLFLENGKSVSEKVQCNVLLKMKPHM